MIAQPVAVSNRCIFPMSKKEEAFLVKVDEIVARQLAPKAG